MRAAILEGFGGPERVRLGQWPEPRPGRGQVLVRVRAAAMNPLDWKMRRGYMRLAFALRPPAVLGFDLAGEVLESGPGAGRFKAGQAVFGSTRRPGAHAERVAVPEALLEPLPTGLSLVEAAALPAAGMSALIIVRDLAPVGAGERVLVNGAAGGLGHLALQLLRERGAHVVAVAGPRNLDFVRSLGAAEAVDHTREDFVGRGGRYDAVLDLVPNRSFPECRPLLAPRGVYVTTLPGGGPIAWALWTRFLSLFRDVPRCRMLMLRPTRRDLKEVARYAAAGTLRPQVEETFPLAEAAKAHARSESGHVRGKLVLTVD
jgi:NADPH:quinone reductase-like Zn-dependent oxidoreductase